MERTNDDALVTVTEAAEYLRVAPGSLYHWVSEGRVPVVRFSARCIRFRRSDIDTWLEQRLVPSLGDTSR
jgi:excisionase family DNA binding protein